MSSDGRGKLWGRCLAIQTSPLGFVFVQLVLVCESHLNINLRGWVCCCFVFSRAGHIMCDRSSVSWFVGGNALRQTGWPPLSKACPGVPASSKGVAGNPKRDWPLQQLGTIVHSDSKRPPPPRQFPNKKIRVQYRHSLKTKTSW